MMKYREILRLANEGMSARLIAKSCACSKSGVTNVLKRAREIGLSWPCDESLDDQAIYELLYPDRHSQSRDRASIDFERIHKELSRPHMTLQLVWQEYCSAAQSCNKKPYQYSSFCEKYREWEKNNGLVMHIEHKAAAEIQVDWVGDTMRLEETEEKAPVKVYIFIAVMVYSGLIYAEGFVSTDEMSWITAHVHAFNFFGGTTPVVIPDNTKTAVSVHTKNKLVLNDQYRRMPKYYDVAIVPARPYRPRDKAAVETVARIVEQQAIAPLRDVSFFSLSELNEALLAKIDDINNRPFQKRPGTRQEVFNTQEKPYLQPLPAVAYQVYERKTATVSFNYHVKFDHIYYSVPFNYVGKQVDILATKGSVAIYVGQTRIASHLRSYGPAESYVTDRAHMPDAHKDFAQWSSDRFTSWAKKIGPSTEKTVQAIIDSRSVEQHAFRSVRALLTLADKYGNDCLELSCKKALLLSRTPTYQMIKSICADEKDTPSQDAYLRGSDYYKSPQK